MRTGFWLNDNLRRLWRLASSEILLFLTLDRLLGWFGLFIQQDERSLTQLSIRVFYCSAFPGFQEAANGTPGVRIGHIAHEHVAMDVEEAARRINKFKCIERKPELCVLGLVIPYSLVLLATEEESKKSMWPVQIVLLSKSISFGSENVNPFTSKSDQCQISPKSVTRNITLRSMKHLAFHSLLR